MVSLEFVTLGQRFDESFLYECFVGLCPVHFISLASKVTQAYHES